MTRIQPTVGNSKSRKKTRESKTGRPFKKRSIHKRKGFNLHKGGKHQSITPSAIQVALARVQVTPTVVRVTLARVQGWSSPQPESDPVKPQGQCKTKRKRKMRYWACGRIHARKIVAIRPDGPRLWAAPRTLTPPSKPPQPMYYQPNICTPSLAQPSLHRHGVSPLPATISKQWMPLQSKKTPRR